MLWIEIMPHANGHRINFLVHICTHLHVLSAVLMGRWAHVNRMSYPHGCPTKFQESALKGLVMPRIRARSLHAKLFDNVNHLIVAVRQGSSNM